MTKIFVKKFAKDGFLGTRLTGQLLRIEAENSLKYTNDVLVVDFDNIHNATQSSIDEFLGVLTRTRGADFLDRLQVVNCNPNIKAVVNFVVNLIFNVQPIARNMYRGKQYFSSPGSVKRQLHPNNRYKNFTS